MKVLIYFVYTLYIHMIEHSENGVSELTVEEQIENIEQIAFKLLAMASKMKGGNPQKCEIQLQKEE